MHVKMKMTNGKMMPRMRWIIVIHKHRHDLSPRYAYFICIINTISACYLYKSSYHSNKHQIGKVVKQLLSDTYIYRVNLMLFNDVDGQFVDSHL